MENRMITRADRVHFLNTGTAQMPVWSPMGEGFTAFAEVKNPIRRSRRFMDEPIRRTDVTGYATSIEYAFEHIPGTPAMERLRQITDEEWIGPATWVEICTVDLFAETDNPGIYRATRRTFAVHPDQCGEGTDALEYTGTLRAVTAPISGVYVKSSGTFSQSN